MQTVKYWAMFSSPQCLSLVMCGCWVYFFAICKALFVFVNDLWSVVEICTWISLYHIVVLLIALFTITVVFCGAFKGKVLQIKSYLIGMTRFIIDLHRLLNFEVTGPEVRKGLPVYDMSSCSCIYVLTLRRLVMSRPYHRIWSSPDTVVFSSTGEWFNLKSAGQQNSKRFLAHFRI